MDERAFEALAQATLARLAERLEKGLGDDAEIELRGGILTLDAGAGGQFVINKHAPNRQIWLSSPVSGATHFAWTGEQWRSTRGPEGLETLLAADLAALTGATLELG